MSTEYGFGKKLDIPYEKAVEKATAALKEQGFGVLTKIDVKATLKEKLGVDFRRYVILGACNPPQAYNALSAELDIGLMLPCNVTVEADPEGGSIVRIADPAAMLQVGDMGQDPVLREVADEARARLERVAKSLERAG